MLRYRLHAAWQEPEEFTKLAAWIRTTEGVSFVESGGFSHINGVCYHSYVDFDDRATAMLCKLIFPKFALTFFETYEPAVVAV